MKLRYNGPVPPWLRTKAAQMINRPVDLTNRYVHVTQLLMPPAMLALQDKHWSELETPIDDLIPAMLGQAWHAYVEGAMPHGTAEQRIEVTHGGWVIIGTPDWFDQERIVDHKTAKVWSRIFGGKREWEEQLNIYRWLLHTSLGLQTTVLQNHVVYVDWTEGGAKRQADHPSKRWEVIDQPVWPIEDIRQFIDKKLEAIEAVNIETDYCTPEDRWERGECFAAMKRGRKSALKLCDTIDQATTAIEGVTGGYVEHRPGNPVRCNSWCSVKEFCPFGKTLGDW